MKKINVNNLFGFIRRGQFNRLIFKKDLLIENVAVFGLYERYIDESNYYYELIIDDRWQTYSNKSIKEDIKYFINFPSEFIKE